MDAVPFPTSVSLFVMLNLVVRCTPSAPASYYFRTVGIKILKQVQDDEGVGIWADAKHLLRAFVALCEIHWRSFWLWRGVASARCGGGVASLLQSPPSAVPAATSPS